MPPQRAIFRHTASAAPEPAAPALGGRLVHRERHVDLGAHRAQRLDAVDRLLGQLDPGGGERARARRPPRRRSRRRWRRRGSPSRGPTAARTAATRPASSPIPTLTFTQRRSPPARAARGRGRGARAVLGADRRVDGDRARRLDRDQLRHRAPGAPARRRSHSARSTAASACGRSRSARQASSAVASSAQSASTSRVGVERGAHGGERDAVVGLERRGLAVRPSRRRPPRAGPAAARARADAAPGGAQRLAERERDAASTASRISSRRMPAESSTQNASWSMPGARQRAVQRRAVGARADGPHDRHGQRHARAARAAATATAEPSSHGSGAVTNAPATIADVEHARALAAEPHRRACACPRAGRSRGRARC